MSNATTNNIANKVAHPIEIVVECHGALTQTFGSDAFRIQLDGEQPDVTALYAALCERQPQASALISRSAVARGDSLINGTQTLTSEDHVALIPPVSGG